MNIGIDGNEANLNVRVGVGQYAFNILLELSRQKTQHKFFIFLKQPPLSDMPLASANWQYIVFGPQKLWTKFALPLHLFSTSPKLDLFYSPSHYSPHFCPCPTIPTIHDLGYLATPKQFTKKDFYQLSQWTQHSLKKATRIMAVSLFTKSELNRIYNINPNIIDIAYNGINTIPQATPINIKSTYNLTKPYFLYLGTLKPNKNIPFLIRSFSEFSPKFQLVIAGKKGWLFEEIFRVVQENHLESSVIFTDYISENEKWSLYKQAVATVLPSLYEGFGIPAIESQFAKTPVIASNIPAYKEVLGQSAILIDPSNQDSLVAALKHIQIPKIRDNVISSGYRNSLKYTWTRSALSLLNTFDAI